MHSKLYMLFTCICVLTLSMVACAPGAQPASSDTAADASAAEANPALESESAPETTVLTIGTAAEFKPFEYIDENGNLVGFDIDLMNAMAQAGGFEIAFVNTTFDGLLVALANGEFDAAIAAITITDERQEVVDFTDMYMEPGQGLVSFTDSGQGIAVRTDNTTIQGPDDLTADVRVGVQLGTTGDFYVTDNTEADVQRFDDAPLALQALANGDADAVVTDIAVIADFIKSNVDLNLRLAGGSFTAERYAIAVNKDNPDVLALLNDALARVRADGTYDRIFNKWFGTP